jgi:hypothetical protein
MMESLMACGRRLTIRQGKEHNAAWAAICVSKKYRTVRPIARQCQVLEVSASGYRQHRARQTGGTGPLQSGRRHVKAIFNEMNDTYG